VTGATGPTGVNVLNTAGTNSMLGHVVQGTGRGTILSGGAAYSSASSYTCYGSDLTNPAGVVTFNYISGTTFEAVAPGSDEVRFVCIGT
jgi:hypothetical protein